MNTPGPDVVDFHFVQILPGKCVLVLQGERRLALVTLVPGYAPQFLGWLRFSALIRMVAVFIVLIDLCEVHLLQNSHLRVLVDRLGVLSGCRCSRLQLHPP